MIFIIRKVYLKKRLPSQLISDGNGEVDHKPVNREVGNTNNEKPLTEEKDKKETKQEKKCICM